MSNIEISQAQRLDQRVLDIVPELSRSFAAKLIEQGKVTVNGEAVTKAGYKMRAGDVVQVDYDKAQFAAIPRIELPVLYEDDDCVVIIKPQGLLTHSKGAFNPEATVATWLRGRISDAQFSDSQTSGPNARAGIVHRLDRATSGVMICAKTPEALTWLQKQFSQRRVKKTYMAIVKGQLDQPHAVIDMPIERNPKKPQTFRVGSNGKYAITEYEVVKTANERSLVKLLPQTGRTHQLRVHMSQLGHPIVGDELYSGPPADRLYLHAESLELTLPNRERRVFEAPLPGSFDEAL